MESGKNLNPFNLKKYRVNQKEWGFIDVIKTFKWDDLRVKCGDWGVGTKRKLSKRRWFNNG